MQKGSAGGLAIILLIASFSATSADAGLLDKSSDQAQSFLTSGRVLFNQSNFPQAAFAFKQAKDLEPDNAEARFELGRVMARQGKEDDALVELFECLRLNQGHADARIETGVILMKRQNWDEAGGQFKQALDLTPANQSLRGNYAICLEQLGFVDQAIEQFRLILQTSPQNIEALYNLGAALKLRGNFAQAADAFKAVIALKPLGKTQCDMVTLALIELGKCYLGLKDAKTAIAVERQAVKLSPRNHLAHLALGHALKEAGLTSQSIDSYRTAIQLKPKDPECVAVLTNLLTKNVSTANSLSVTR